MTTTIISKKLDQSLSDMMRLATKKEGGDAISERIGKGREEMSRLGASVTSLRSVLTKLKAPVIERNFSVSAGKVAARSLTMGLTYDSDPAADDPARALNEIARFSTVSAGSVKINGVAVSIDPATDSLDVIVARINGSGAGVTARLNRSGDRFEIVSDKIRMPLILEDSTSGFFSAAGITPRYYQPTRSVVDSFGGEKQLLNQFKELGDALDEIFRGTFSELDGTLLDQLRDGLKKAVTDVVKAHGGNITGTPMRSGYGVDFDFGFFSKETLKLDAHRFMKKATSDFDATLAFLAGDASKNLPGLAPALLDAFDKTLNETVTEIGNKFAAGLLTDLKA